jgi:acetyl-CoA carboxylase biotin carboxylase subunit
MSKKRIRKILVANRGEIALRIIKACREMDIATVAVYSEVDHKLPHVLEADQAVEIGPAPPLESYLNIEKIVDTAKQFGCEAIHPGYGFLAENAEFTRHCRDRGVIFIGPDPEAMEMVGDKITARAKMREAKIPITPGMEVRSQNWQQIQKDAASIGYPVMIKASAGGGGKGMRIVHRPEDLQSAIEAGRREAKSAFGNDTVYMEKYLENPRHVEFQVLADNYGNVVHLFERECSIQRRHQKIIEETPSPALDEKLRLKMGETACRVMAAVNYNNAGTVEFLLDQNKNFYFLEVNARIQVEHPVTELVTGIDLVKQQIRIASGEKLTLKQETLRQRGHAMECRIYAEDPENNFFPSVGKLLLVREPQGPGIRCDSGIYSGLEVTHFYDPILSKLIVWSESREETLKKMSRALSDYIILGVKTPIPFLKALIAHPNFVSGDFHTGFIGKHFENWKFNSEGNLLQIALLAAAHAGGAQKQTPASVFSKETPTPWQTLGEWRLFS